MNDPLKPAFDATLTCQDCGDEFRVQRATLPRKRSEAPKYCTECRSKHTGFGARAHKGRFLPKRKQ